MYGIVEDTHNKVYEIDATTNDIKDKVTEIHTMLQQFERGLLLIVMHHQ